MAQYTGFPTTKTLEPDEWRLDGYIGTNHTGVVLNTASQSTAPLRADGSHLVFPKGITSVAKTATTGEYAIVLEQPWSSLIAAIFVPVSGSALAGTIKLKKWNTTASVDSWGQAAQTIVIQFEQSGSGAVLADAGFHMLLLLKNSKTLTV